jgi:hypothetical protein
MSGAMMDDSFTRLVASIEAELAALEAEDADAITAATTAKTAALEAVKADLAAGVPMRRDLLEQARDLNAQAILRSRAKLIGVERRLAGIMPTARPETLVYGRDGRLA